MISFNCIQFLWASALNSKGRFKGFPDSWNLQGLLKPMSVWLCCTLARSQRTNDGFERVFFKIPLAKYSL